MQKGYLSCELLCGLYFLPESNHFWAALICTLTDDVTICAIPGLFRERNHGAIVDHPILQELHRATSSFVGTEGSGVCLQSKVRITDKSEIRTPTS